MTKLYFALKLLSFFQKLDRLLERIHFLILETLIYIENLFNK